MCVLPKLGIFLIISVRFVAIGFDVRGGACTMTSIKSWADKLGVELWHLGNFITRRKEVQDVSVPIV